MPPKKSPAPATPSAPSGAARAFTLDEITALVSLVHEKNFDEFELEQGPLRMKIVARRPAPPVVHMAPAPMPAMAPMAMAQHAPAAQAPAAEAPREVAAASGAAKPDDADAKFSKVTSPMVGTFYRSPAPGAKPFVEVGDVVQENSVLCIIEAMKLMNEIKAEMRGTVRKILVDNGKPVEYGQALFLVEPS
jgi:acetyl-CoA carboxylase biotin carboxyl carrier protein